MQDTLLKGFAMIGRGDLHGPGSSVASPRAYLFRTATNLWLDGQRRRVREQAILAEPQTEPAETGADALRVVGEELGVPVAPWGYHQPPEVLVNMIATTTLPWGEGMKLHY